MFDDNLDFSTLADCALLAEAAYKDVIEVSDGVFNMK